MSMGWEMGWEAVAALGQIGGAVVAAIGLYAIWKTLDQQKQQLGAQQRQLAEQVNTARGEFLFHIEDQLHRHEVIARRLAHGGDLDGSESKPEKGSEDMAAAQRYMGFLERLGKLVEQGSIPEDWVREFYRWRVNSVMRNGVLLARVQNDAGGRGWTSLKHFAKRLGCADDNLRYIGDKDRVAVSEHVEDVST